MRIRASDERLADLPTGITRTPHGFRVCKRVNGHLYTKRFKDAAEIPKWIRWRHELAIRLDAGAPALVQSGHAFRDDARAYLLAVRGMPTYRWRADDIALWVEVFGDRARADIQSHEIRAQLAKWRTRYAANTCNHRRTALLHLWTVLDGKSKPNPVRDVPRYRDDSQDRPPRALAPPVLRALFATMAPSATKARLQLIAWTGWPHAVIYQITSRDIDWRGRRVYVHGRLKGKGTKGSWRELMPRGWAALRIFAQLKAWGPFSSPAARISLRLAATKVGKDTTLPAAIREAVEDITPYDLRHSFLTLVAVIGKDDRAVASVAGHSDMRMGARYTGAATDPRVTSALEAVTTALKLARKRAG
jgi:integrase